MKLIQLLLTLISLTTTGKQVLDIVVRLERIRRRREERAAFKKAIEEAPKKNSTVELQKQLSKFLILVLLISGCATKQVLPSLCILDFEKQMCWVDEELNLGYPFGAMDAQVDACKKGEGPCWFSLDSNDLKKIHDRLSRGQ